jgi:hypothetical protein
MPEHETLGKLTERMLDDGLIPYQMEEDKSDLLFGTDGATSVKAGMLIYTAGSNRYVSDFKPFLQ